MRYDAIVSLGGNCSAAFQLQARGLRFYSLPFDWLRMQDESTLSYLCRAFPEQFEDFCLRENLVRLDPKGRSGTAPYLYHDNISGYDFLHHFHRPAEDEDGYMDTFSVLRKRIIRLYTCLESAQTILFILAPDFNYSLHGVRRLMDVLRSLYSRKMVDFALLQFCAQFSNNTILSERWPWEDVAYGARYARHVTHYDLDYTSVEWAFLDDVMHGGHQRPKLLGWSKFEYKIWKHLSNRLTRRGYGCKGIVFN